jgi:hypothetical protein
MTSKTGSRLGRNCPRETPETPTKERDKGNDFGPNLDEKSSCGRYFGSLVGALGSEELPTIRSLPPLAKPQISSLIADSHGPTSGDGCTGDKVMPACWGSWSVRLTARLRQEALMWFAQIEHTNSFCGKEA